MFLEYVNDSANAVRQFRKQKAIRMMFERTDLLMYATTMERRLINGRSAT